jgi:ferredoxin
MPEGSPILFIAGEAEILAEPQENVLSAMLRAGEAIQTVCKGKGICGACRVIVDGPGFDRLNPPSASEARLLKYLDRHEGNSEPLNHRLACQIVLTSSLSGLRVTPDPIRPFPSNRRTKP